MRLFVLSIFMCCLAFNSNALEVTAGGASFNNQKYSDASNAFNKATHSLLTKVLKCNAKKMFYVPEDATADSEGCVGVEIDTEKVKLVMDTKTVNLKSCQSPPRNRPCSTDNDLTDVLDEVSNSYIVGASVEFCFGNNYPDGRIAGCSPFSMNITDFKSDKSYGIGSGRKYFRGEAFYDASNKSVRLTGSAGGWGSCGGNWCTGRVTDPVLKIKTLKLEVVD